MNEMQEAARRLHALGFKTLPIRPGTKEPATLHGVKDATASDAETDAYYAAHPNHGIGVSGEGFVIFDFDVKDGLDGRDQLLGWKLPDTLAQTTPSGGYHLFYRTEEEVRPSVNADIAVDVRGWHSYVVCDPTPGYRFEEDCGIADADGAVMAFLVHVRPQKRKTTPYRSAGSGSKKLKEGQGRNEDLYRYGCSLQSDSRPDEEIEGLMYAYNRAHFDPPLDQQEFGKCVRNVLTNIPKGHSEEVKAQEARRGRGRRFDHAAVGDRLIAELGMCFVDGMPAVQDGGGAYRTGWRAVDAEIVRMHKDATKANQAEVHHYLNVTAPKRRQSRPTLIAFTNGVLDVETMELLPYSDEMVIPNVVPHAWNTGARCAAVDTVLENMSEGDVGLQMNLTEVMGLIMFRSSKYPVCPVLLGAGANGKSTYIDMLGALVGEDNMSALQPREIGMRFQAGQLVGKLANLGDDISNDYIDGDACSAIKKIATGNVIYTDVKGGEGFNFRPYCTMVFCANKFPRLGDSSYGMMRRLFPMGFRADFKAGARADFDPSIGEKVTTEEACEYMCLLGVEGLRRVMAQNGMTPNDESATIVHDVEVENNSVLQWIENNDLSPEDVLGRTGNDVHEEYSRWCQGHAVKSVGPRNFNGTLAAQWHVSLCAMEHFVIAGKRKTKRVYAFDGTMA